MTKAVELAERLERWRLERFPEVDARDLLSDEDMVLIIQALRSLGEVDG